MRKEVVTAYFKVKERRVRQEGLRKVVRVVGVPAEIRIEDLPNTSVII
jgi:hypothetical protein